MSVYIDRKYLLLISSRLHLFRQKKDDLFNFRCPICGDSRKHKLKARGYVFRKDNDYFYRCHNCNIGLTFSNFLKQIDSYTHQQYALERYSEGSNGHSNYEKPNFDELKGNAFSRLSETEKPTTVKNPRENIKSIDTLGLEHYATQYVIGRKIPEKFWSELYFTEHFKDFMDASFPEHDKEDIPNDDRLVMFYTNENGDITNVAGRTLSGSKIRYITIKVSDEKKLFGTHRVDKSKPVVVVEGQIDSYFIENCVASGDSNLVGVADLYKSLGVQTVLAYDNEPRNRDIVKQMGKAIEAGYSVVIWPQEIPEGEDVNSMVEKGYDVDSLIASNIYKGLTANLKYVEWKKV